MAQTPEPTKVNLASSALFINQRCRKCKFFKRMAHPAYEKACSVIGILPEAKPCEKFTPDARTLRFSSPRHANAVTDVLRNMSKEDLETLASLATQERITRRNGYFFGDRGYLRAFGDDYLSNYRRVIVVAADSLYVHIEADAGFSALVFKDSILSPEQWIKKRAWLEANEREVDPRYKRYIRLPTQAELQAAKVRSTMDALDLTIANGGRLTEGAHIDKRSTPITDLIVERRAVPSVIRTR